jgi:broad-specificity NMP kinase
MAAPAGPNVLVTGTPGTGKSTLCALVAAALGGRVEHVDVSAMVKDQGLHEGWDEERQCFILDEDKVRPSASHHHARCPLCTQKSSRHLGSACVKGANVRTVPY